MGRLYRPWFLLWWRNPIPACLLLDDRETALELLKEAPGRPTLRQFVRVALRVDPRMKPWAADRTDTGMFIHQRCGRLIESLPAMQHDPNRPEDVLKVDADEAATAAMTRRTVYDTWWRRGRGRLRHGS